MNINKTNKYKLNNGFTIVELLVVIVVIGILAAITLVSYNGISARANTAALQSDLSNTKTQLAVYQAENGSFPTALDGNKCPSAPIVDTKNCLKTNSTNILTYTGNEVAYNLTIKKGNTTYGVSNNSGPIDTTQPTSCSAGYIPVPGSATYGTKGFCVMKYEAKNDGSNNAVSNATATPYVSISQTDAITKSSAACTGCHLISEAEWMTIAQNVLSVPSNWSGGTVGSGFIYSGHNDNSPSSALVADASDANGYNGTGQTTGSNQRRTLTLTNGEVIWDMAGNAWEWTAGRTTGNQPGIEGAGYGWREWLTLTTPGALAVNSTPEGTGLAGADAWNSANGVGKVYSNSNDAVLRGHLRGGGWDFNTGVGVLYLNLLGTPSDSDDGVGFRVSRN